MTLFETAAFGPMRHAITLWQPMAYAVIHLGKTIENRPHIAAWNRAAGRTVAIHAGLTWNDEHAGIVEEITGKRIEPHYAAIHFGAIIGTVDVLDVHWADGECCDPWGFTGGAHLVLDRAMPCDPIPCRGALGLWTVPEDVARELAAVRA